MYIINNALKNLVRNKGRNALIGGILLVLIIVSVIFLGINNTANTIIDDYKARFGSKVTIALDFSKVMGDSNDMFNLSFDRITSAQIKDFAKSDYLSNVVTTASATASSEAVTAVDEDASGNSGIIMGNGNENSEFDPPKFNLKSDNWSSFENGDRTLAEGEMPQDSGECLISTQLAGLNYISVGDTITLTRSIAVTDDDGTTRYEDKAFALTVSGIYFDPSESTMPIKLPMLSPQNDIMVGLDTLTAEYGDNVSMDSVYYLKDPTMLEDFEAEIRAKGLSEDYSVSTDEASYEKVVGPVEGLKKISLTFMFVVLGFGAVVLVLLSYIAVRERKYEIGVLRAMGMKKSKVALGFWTEMLAITMGCLVIGFGIGAVAAQPVSDTLLAEQVEVAQTEAESGFPGMNESSGFVVAGSETTDAVPLDKMDVSIGTQTLAQIALLALVLASLASIAAISQITKYEPMWILSERN